MAKKPEWNKPAEDREHDATSFFSLCTYYKENKNQTLGVNRTDTT